MRLRIIRLKMRCPACHCELFEPEENQIFCNTCEKEKKSGYVPKLGTFNRDSGGGVRIIRDSKTLA